MQKAIARLSTTLINTIDQTTNLVFPPRCLGCDRYLKNLNHQNSEDLTQKMELEVACSTCQPTIYRLEGPGCPQCARPRHTFLGETAPGVNDLCVACLERPPAFQKAAACFEYEGVISDTILSIKYAHQLHKIRSLAKITRPWMLEHLQNITTDHPIHLMPVPMHARDLRQRGFNPAALLLHQLVHKTPFKIHTNLIHKTRQTPSQAGLSRDERLRNLRDAFTATLPSELTSQHDSTAVLFDDVLTTTATTHEVSKTLLDAGFTRVIVLVIARATGTGQLSDFV